MTLFLLLAAAGFSLAALLTDNHTMLMVGLGIWVLGVLSGAAALARRRRTFGSVEKAQVAAAAGDPRAMRALALVAKVNGQTDQAEHLLLAAIDRGDVESMWELGRLVEDRDGLAACEPWFRMAAENGHFAAKRFFRRGGAFNLDGKSPL
jgi:TPR repeat protein